MKRIIDISYYQKPEDINYDLLLSQVDGVIIRLGYGVGAKTWIGKPDPAFERHYAECKARGIPVGCYHFMVEYAPVNDQLAIVKQALDGKQFELGFWADVELEGGVAPLTRSTVIEYITKIEAYLGHKIGIYTGAWAWNPIMGNDNPYSSRRLWTASYTSTPYIPIGWSQYFIWQYTSSGRLDGYAGALDMNRITDENWRKMVGEPVIDEIEPLKVPLFSQKDPRWSGKELGTSPVTIGGYGCLITAAAMVAKYFGKDTDPGRLNKALIEVGGYDSQNLLRHSAMTTLWPDIVVKWPYFLSDPNDALIDEVLMQELPVIVQVDYRPDTSALDQHWVIIVGKDEHGYIIADPIDGQVAYLSRYAGKAYRMVVYEYQQTEDVLFKAKVLAKKLNVRSEPVYLPDNSNVVDLLDQNKVENVYQVNDANGWLRIGVSRWITGSPTYVEKIEIEQPEPPLTLEEQVADHEIRITALENA